MGSQSEAFLNGLGDEWLERNRADLGKKEPDLPMRFLYMANPGKVLEIGCANGWRLKKLQELGWDVFGVEPSEKAVLEAMEILGSNLRVLIGTADEYVWGPDEFDVVILGGCMCLADPEDWPQIVSSVDAQLKMGGHLLINDFDIGDYGGPMTMTQDTITPEEPYHPFTLRSIYWPSLWINFPTYQVVEAAREKGTRNVCYMLQKERHWLYDQA